MREELYKYLREHENCNKMFLEDLIEKNDDKLIHYTQAKTNKKYESVFNYSERHGGTFDSFKYYNNYVVEINE